MPWSPQDGGVGTVYFKGLELCGTYHPSAAERIVENKYDHREYHIMIHISRQGFHH